MAEAMKLAVADRSFCSLGADCPTDALLSDAYIGNRRAKMDPTKPGMSEGDRFDGHLTGTDIIPHGSPKLGIAVPESTTHFNVIDGEGNAVAVTESLGDGFGSGVMAGDAGFVLNNSIIGSILTGSPT